MFRPATAGQAGSLDTVVPADQLLETAHAVAARLRTLNMPAHIATKLRARAATLDALRAAIEADDAEMQLLL